MVIEEIIDYLRKYDGKPLSFMEVCGTHTAAISENGIPSLLSDKISLITGPGCPVCVTVAQYIDRLCELAMDHNTCIVTFGDLIRVPGQNTSLQSVKSMGADIKMVYSPFEIIDMAKENPNKSFVFAAVGFETTTPIYALLIEKIIAESIENIKLLTALKTMPAAIEALCNMGTKVDGFIAPGNVSVIIGENPYLPLAEKFSLPFVISGFEGKELLSSIYALTKLNNQGKVLNLYKYAVKPNGNIQAQEIVSKYFKPCDAVWRGIGEIKNSGMVLKDGYRNYDAGSLCITADSMKNNACKCADVVIGKSKPTSCPLYSKVCTPENPQGACMVSNEGACFNYFINKRG